MKLTEDVFFMANQRDFVESLDQETKRALIWSVVDSHPDDCLTCLFYKSCPGKGECAIGYDTEIDVPKMRDKICPVGEGLRDEA